MRRSKKAMALAGTLIMMTIVMMLSVLMMSLMLYSSQLTGVQTANIDNRAVLDEMGQRFINSRDDYEKFLAHYVDGDKVKYYGADANPSDDPTNVIKGSIGGMKVIVAVKDTGNTRTLSVKSLAKERNLLEVVCALRTDDVTGEKTAQLKSWNYGIN